MRYGIFFVALVSAIVSYSQENMAKIESGEELSLFSLTDLLAIQDSLDKTYLPFFDNEHLSMGIYTLEVGAQDKQEPHKIDEAYYVLEGKAKFQVSETHMDVSPGDIIFVQAQAPHHFYEITNQLKLLVFFAKHP